MALSPMVLFAVFPAAWDVLLNSQRGEELRASVGLFGHIFLHLENSFDRLFNVYQTELFSLRAIYEQIFLFILIMGGTFLKLCDKKMSAETAVCLGGSLGMGFFLALFMPEMGVFDLRYFSLLMPFFALLSVLFVVRIFEAAGICQNGIIGILGMGVLLNSLTADFRQRSAFVFGCDDRFSSFVSDTRGKKIVVKTDVMQPYFDGLGIYKESDSVFLTRDRCLSSVRQDVLSADFVLVYNLYAQYCLECSPKPKQLCPEDYAFVRYVSPLRIGIVYFDLYDVIK